MRSRKPTRDFLWIAGWFTVGAALQYVLWRPGPSEEVQFWVQYVLVAGGLSIPATLTFLHIRALARFPMHWKIAAFLIAVSFLTGPPWDTPLFSCQIC